MPDARVDREAEHRGQPSREAGLDVGEQFVEVDGRWVQPVVQQGLVIRSEGVAERGRFVVEVLDIVGPELLRGDAEERKRTHGGAEVRTGVALEVEEVARHLVDEAAGAGDVGTGGLNLKVLKYSSGGIGRARAKIPLIHNGRTLGAQVNERRWRSECSGKHPC
ncbi:hypothetical protein [Streptomyces sp. NPDC053079]|uniref:hypothetical protein n=1 Tax=Streptomyces sp. NPDC053079 TaxID=3365697 RepID=UPI0037D8F7FB